MQVDDLHLYLKSHSSTGVFQTFCYQKPTNWFLHQWNIGRKWVNIHFTVIWFVKFTTPRWWLFVWLWKEVDFGINKEAYRKRSSTKASEKGVFIRFKVQNKQSPLSVPRSHSRFLNLLLWLRRSSAFSENSRPNKKVLISNNAIN